MFTAKFLTTSRSLLTALSGIILLLLLTLTAPVHAQVCVDSDGDGWGWDGSNSCRVTQEQAQTAAGNGSCVDDDGDGYGWDGQGTCLVAPQSTAVPATTTAGPSAAGACVDSDGDGWGWNGVGSCRVSGSAPSVATQTPTAAAPPASVTPTIQNNSFDRNRDLVAIHFDHAPDRDDGHAAVAALMVRDRLGLNVQVVAGAHGVHNRDRYDPESERLMSTVWGSEWLNAHSNRAGSISAAVNRWTAVLAAGGSVWVAEGGQSDFTAAVVRTIRSNHSEFNTSQRIHVIQHSDWNEVHALAADLNYVRNNTRYVKIADGNDPNSTADFRFESHNNGGFVSRAQSSRYSNEWAAAFNYLTPGDKLDFSDTVELMHIVGLGTNVIRDVNEFGDYFF